MPHAGASHLVEAVAESDKGRRPPIIPATHKTPGWKKTVQEKMKKKNCEPNAGAVRPENATPDSSAREFEKLRDDTRHIIIPADSVDPLTTSLPVPHPKRVTRFPIKKGTLPQVFDRSARFPSCHLPTPPAGSILFFPLVRELSACQSPHGHVRDLGGWHDTRSPGGLQNPTIHSQGSEGHEDSRAGGFGGLGSGAGL